MRSRAWTVRPGRRRAVSALLGLVAGSVASTAAMAQAVGPPTTTPVTVTVDEGQPQSAFNVSGGFAGNGCFLATGGQVVVLNGGAPAALDGGTLTAGAAGASVSYASNTGLAFGSFTTPLAYNYQCAVGGPVQTTAPPTSLTLTIGQFAPGTTSIVVPENAGPTTIGPAMLAPGRQYGGVTVQRQPTHGTVTVSGGTSLVYTPTPGTFGTDTFQYLLAQTAASGATYNSALGTVSVTVTQGLAVAEPDTVNVPGNVASTLNVVANDLNGPFLAVAIATPPAHGTASVAGGTLGIVYTPTTGYSGPDTLAYTVTNAVGRSAPATVSITVAPVATAAPPTAPPLAVSTPAGTPVTVDVTAGVAGGPFTGVAITRQPPAADGTARVQGLTIVFTPAANFAGTATLLYTISNANGTSAPAQLSVTVGAAAAPAAKPLAVSTPPGTPVTVDVTNGIAGGPFTAIAIVQPPPAADGTARVQGLSIVFTPTATFAGTATLLYTISNAGGTSAPASLSITVGQRENLLARPDTSALLNAQLDTARRFYEVQIQNFGNRLEQLHHGARGFSLMAYGFALDKGLVPLASPDDSSGSDQDSGGTGGGPGQHADAQGAQAGAGGGPAGGGGQGGGAAANDASAGGGSDAGPSGGGTSSGGASASASVSGTAGGASGSSGGASASASASGSAGGASASASASGSAGGASASASPSGSTSGSAASAGSPSEGGGAPAPTGEAASGSGSGSSASSGGGESGSGTGDSGKPAGKTPQKPAPEDTGIELPDRLGAFLTPLGNIGDKSAEYHHSGFDFQTVGFSLGADYRLNDWIVAGLGGGFSQDQDTIGSDGSRSDAHSFNITAYGTIQATDQIYVDGILTWATLNFDSKRLATTSGVFAYGDRDGEQLYGALSSGYEFDIGALTLAPYLRLNLASAVLNAFAEHGAGSASMTVGKETLTDLSTVFGFRGDYAISLEESILSPHFRVEFQHEFAGGSHTNLDYADQPTGPFYQFAADPVDRNNITVGVGASWLTENALAVTFDYEILLAYRNEQSHNFTVGVTRRF
jgi:uncharacterized protein YhjY with autotransporter beta-barrel domain